MLAGYKAIKRETKVRLRFKTPDALDFPFSQLKDNLIAGGLSGDVLDETLEEERERFLTLIQKWVRDGEYINIEIDIGAETCVVLESK